MKRFLFAVITIFFSLAPIYAGADTTDHLWIKVIDQNKAIKKWLAKDWEQSIVVTKAKETPKTILIKKQFDKVEEGTAVYKVISFMPAVQTNKLPATDFEERFMKEEEPQIFSTSAKTKRIGNQILEGKSAVLYEIIASDSKVKLWVNGENGTIYRRLIEFSFPLMFEGSLETNYGPNDDGKQVVQGTNSNISINMPFRKAKIQITDRYSNWFQRP